MLPIRSVSSAKPAVAPRPVARLSASPTLPPMQSPGLASPARDDALFKDNPLSGTYVLNSGAVVPTPYHCYDADLMMIMGTADLATAQRLMGDKAHQCQVTVDGNRALVTLFVSDYKDTSLGPYREFILSTSVGEAPHDISSTNPCALIAPLFDGVSRGQLHQLALNKEAVNPIGYGREILGFDKIASDARVRRSGRDLDFAFDAGKRRIISGHVEADTSWWTRITTSFNFVRAIGIKRMFQFMKTRIMETPIISVDPLSPSHVKSTQLLCKGIPTINMWGAHDRVNIGSAPLGQTLASLDFKPLLTVRYPHAKFVMQHTVSSP